jgi:hypothetical protein
MRMISLGVAACGGRALALRAEPRCRREKRVSSLRASIADARKASETECNADEIAARRYVSNIPKSGPWLNCSKADMALCRRRRRL